MRSEPGPLLPIGGGYSDIYAGFSAAAIANARDGQVTILVLPTAYSSNPTVITDAERAANLQDAEERRFQVEEACKRFAPADVTCRAILAPIFTRADAADPEKLAPLRERLAAIFILGGDQTVAMQALADTPAEDALAEAHAAGAVVAGTSAGGAMLSVTMLAGYNPNYAAANSLDFGAADVWNTAGRRGLRFGVRDAILDQHFFQRGRLGRLLNAIALPEVPHVGIGVDAYTGVQVQGGTQLGRVFGLYTVAVLDAETYHAADGVHYVSVPDAGDRPPILSLRNVLVHLLSAGDYWYDLATRQHGLASPATRLERAFDTLRTPVGAGTLFLAGDLSQKLQSPVGSRPPALERFYQRAGGPNARLLIYADGYPSARSARNAAEAYAAVLAAPAELLVAGEADVTPSLQGITGVVLIARDQSKLDPSRLAWLRGAWEAGTPVLADNAAAPLLGAFYAAHGPTPKDAEQAEIATQKSFRVGETQIKPGLGLLNVTLEPQLLNDNRWGRLFSLAYHRPERLAIGLTRNAVLVVGTQGAEVAGENVVFFLDFRQATLAVGQTGGFVVANGLLDVFAPGETVVPSVADTSFVPLRQPTPVLPSSPSSAVAPMPTPLASPIPEAPAPRATATAGPATPSGGSASSYAEAPAPRATATSFAGSLITAVPPPRVSAQPRAPRSASNMPSGRFLAVAAAMAVIVFAAAAWLFWRLRRKR